MSIIPDVDGAALIFGKEYYDRYHHTVGHSLLFALITSAVVAGLARQKIRCTALAFLSFHAHLLSDLLGSGADWSIFYLWPSQTPEWKFAPPFVWELSSWQNFVVTVTALFGVAAFAVLKQRTFVEFFSPSVDARIVAAIRKWAI